MRLFMNNADLKTIVEKESPKTAQMDGYALSFITPLEGSEFLKSLKFAYKQVFKIDYSDELINVIRSNVGSQQFYLIYIKQGLDSNSHLSHQETFFKLSPIVYYVLKNGLTNIFPSDASLDKTIKIKSTFLVDAKNDVFPNLNQIFLTQHLIDGVSPDDVSNEKLKSLMSVTKKLHKEHDELTFDFSPKEQTDKITKVQKNSTKLVSFYTISDEDVTKLFDAQNMTTLGDYQANVCKKALSYLKPIDTLVRESNEKTP